MKKSILHLIGILIFISCTQTPKMTYPETKKTDTVDVYFGAEVPDPYRWLEDDNSEETKEWVKAQNDVTFKYLQKIPFRDKIKSRLETLWNYPRMSSLTKRGKYYIYSKNDGLQNQSVVYYTENPDKEGKVLLDPNTLSEDGTVALSGASLSKDSRYLAYSIARGGSDWNEIYVLNVETGKTMKDHIEWVKFSGISWYNDGFFYCRLPEPKEGDALKGESKNSMVYYHKVGTAASEDILIHKDDLHPDWLFNAEVTDDKQWLLLSITESTTGNALYAIPMEDVFKPTKSILKLIDNFSKDYLYITSIDGKLIIHTNNNAPKYKVVSIDPKNPSSSNWIDFIEEKESVLEGLSFVGQKFFLSYLKDARSLIEIYSKEGVYEKELGLPFIGSVSGFGGEKNDEITFYTLTSFVSPGTVYKYNIKEGISEIFYKPEIDFDTENYEVKQEFYPSKDGTEIPMFIVHKKGLDLNGKNPTLLYGYGGFNISLTPTFSVTRLIWLENNGVFAMANLRGGGEYGEEWHEAGTKLNKQNVFDDFISAGEYLIEKKYTSSDFLTIMGGSNGGLLVGAVANQRPDLFKVALPAVGVMDMLRYHKFTIGRFWAADYGTSEDSKEMFEYLYGYSPLHTIKTNTEYPAILVTTADHDDRVVPAHSFKYISTLQEKYQGNNPVLIRIDVKAGHGAGKSTSKVIDEYADVWGFAFYNMGIEPK